MEAGPHGVHGVSVLEVVHQAHLYLDANNEAASVTVQSHIIVEKTVMAPIQTREVVIHVIL